MTEFLIIGNGVFGLSASTYLRTQGCQFQICARSKPHSPCQDTAKISRVDYPGLVRMKEAQKAHNLWITNNFYKQFCSSVGRVVAYDHENYMTLKMINQNRQLCKLARRKAIGAQAFTEAFGGSQTSDLEYIYNNDDLLIDWASVISSLRTAVESETTAPVRRLIPGAGQVDAVVIENAVNGEEIIDTTDMKIILAVGPWITTILDLSGIEGPPGGLPVVAVLAFHLAINNEQNDFYSNKPIFSHIGTGEILPPVNGQQLMKVTWTKRPFITAPNWLISAPDLSQSAFVAREAQAMRQWVLKSHPRLKKAKVTSHFYWDAMAPGQVPYITQHPQYSNLTIAGGGSYTHGKDLPTIGQLIVKAAQGDLQAAPKNRHGWHRQESLREPDNQPLLSTGQTYEELEKQALEYYKQSQENVPNLLNFYI